MTPEELNRTMEFIIETQAHLSASLDREHEMREERFAESEKTQRSLASLQAQVVEMIRTESDRLDRQDKMLHDAQKLHDEWQKHSQKLGGESQKRNEEFQRDALHLLHQILDRLTKNPNQNAV